MFRIFRNQPTNKEHDNEPSLLANSPKELQEKIYAYLLPKELGIFAQTSSQGEADTALSRLQYALLSAEPESYQQEDPTKLASLAILKKYPQLLFATRGKTVTDHYGREMMDVPYRILLGTNDPWALKQVHEEILSQIPNGKSKAKAQFCAQFPNCPWPFDPSKDEEVFYDERNKKQIIQVKAQLKVIVKQIRVDPCTLGQATLIKTKEAVAKLWQIFTPKEGKIIRTGLHFPQAIMQAILDVYQDHDNTWQTGQFSFYSHAVIGPAQAALTAVDGQSCKKGLPAIVNNNQSPDRRDSLLCRHQKNIPKEFGPLIAKLIKGSAFVNFRDGEICTTSETKGYFNLYPKNGGLQISGPGLNQRSWAGGGIYWIIHTKHKQDYMIDAMQLLEERAWRCVIL